MDELLAWLQRTEGPLGYLVIALASLIEYVFPPFPGDTVAVFGVFLAVTAGYRVLWVYLALEVGAVVGGMMAYGFGRWLATRRAERQPRFLRTQQARQALNLAIARFERHGSAYLALNRFVPALRAFFFVAAGLAGIRAWKVALWGAVSAALWNALLLAVGWFLGDSFERLRSLTETYGFVVLGVLAVGGLVMAVRWWRGRAKAGSDED